MIRETNAKTLPWIASVGGGETKKGGSQHKMEMWPILQSREGGKCLVENAYVQREDKITFITTKIKQNITQSFATVWVARLPLPPLPARG